MANPEFSDPVHLIEYLQKKTILSLDRIADIADIARVRGVYKDDAVEVTYDRINYTVKLKK